MQNIFDQHCAEGQKFIKELALQLGQPQDLDHAYRVLRSVLHTLRHRIAVEESMHIVSQLPLILKGVYIDGWKITDAISNSKTIEEFLAEVRSLDRVGPDFADDISTRQKIKTVFLAIRQYVDDGEFRHILLGLPKEIAEEIAA